MSTAYHPQSDGQTERANQEIETYLRIYCSRRPETWANHIPEIEFCHNHREQSAIKDSPFHVMMGYHPRTWPDTPDESSIPTINERLKELSSIRSEALAAHELARQSMADRIRRQYPSFRVGDKVWLDSRNIALSTPAKFKKRHLGPFPITKAHGKLNFELELPDGWQIHPVFHAGLLSKYHETEAHGPAYLEPPPDVIDGSEEYEVEAILSEKGKGRKKKYLVAWRGYSDQDNEWVDAKDIENAQEALEEYRKRKETTKTSKRKPRRRH